MEGLKVSPARQESPFLTTKQAAYYLCLSSRTLEKMRETARGPRFRRHGRYIRYHIDDIPTWSEEHSSISTSDKANFVPV
ncbi:MAG: DNA-binding protein, partial [Negativicutes bacterium]|nr:DNA-binding protein [Negativicutes bacterium]